MNRETGKEKVNQDYSRREFIKATALTVGAAGALSICGLAPASCPNGWRAPWGMLTRR